MSARYRELLKAGALGVEWAFPEHWEIREERDGHIVAVELERALVWHVIFSEGAALDLSEPHRPHLVARLHRYARAMFDGLHASHGETDEPRTSDPDWTPMIEVSYPEVCGARAIRTIHRMAYEPGSEIVMGHLMIPLQVGLFELRSVCQASQTGMRESILMAERGLDSGYPGQAFFDDSAHDPSFESHPLSLTRAGLDAATGFVRAVTAPLGPAPDRQEYPASGCVLTPPPRFRRLVGAFTRVSFCTTDGLEHLQVERADVPDGANLEAHAKAFVQRLLESSAVQNVYVRSRRLDDGSVVAFGLGMGHQGPLRHAFLWTPRRAGVHWRLTLFGDGVSPEDELVDELWRSSLTCRPSDSP